MFRSTYILTLGRYVGAADGVEDSEPFEEKIERLAKTLKEQMVEEARLNEEITKQLKKVGFKL